MNMYALSIAVNELGVLAPQLLPTLVRTHAYRYKHFVQNSKRGLKCTYATATARAYVADKQEQVLLLQLGIDPELL